MLVLFLRNGFQEIAVCGIVFVAGFGILAFIAGLIIYKLRQNVKNRAAWREASQKLNLTMRNPKKLELKGVYHGCEILLAVGRRSSGHGDERHVEYYTCCQSAFPLPLRFLLDIRAPKGLFSGVFKSDQMFLGQPNFDKVFNVKCYDGEVLRRLLLSDFPSDKTQNLMGDLMLTNQSAGVVKVSDERVYLEKSGIVSDFETLKEMLDMTSRLANRFKNAREKFPLAEWEKHLLASWKALADENDLKLDAVRFQMQGIYKNFPVFAALDAAKGKWRTEIKLRFPQNLQTGLKIMPENSLHKAFTWLGAQDIESGIKEFDDSFIVKAKNAGAARSKLKPDLCGQLVALNKRASNISIDDEQISFSFDGVLGDGKILKSYLQAIAATAELLRR